MWTDRNYSNSHGGHEDKNCAFDLQVSFSAGEGHVAKNKGVDRNLHVLPSLWTSDHLHDHTTSEIPFCHVVKMRPQRAVQSSAHSEKSRQTPVLFEWLKCVQPGSAAHSGSQPAGVWL